MKRLSLTLLLLGGAAACQPEARRLLLVDMTLTDPLTLDHTAGPWDAAGYHVEYRQFYPHLTRADLERYRAVIVLGGREPQAQSDALTLGDLVILSEWVRNRDGVVILGYAAAGRAGTRARNEEGTLDRWIMNQWLAWHGAGVAIGEEIVETGVLPRPRSALDNAGFAPFPAGRNRTLQVRDNSQTLARTPAGGEPLIAASRVDDGLVVVASRSLLGSAGESARTRDFLETLARWTRRPAEWAAVRTATNPAPLRLSGAPQPVAVHPPPLRPPDGAAPVPLPLPPSTAADSVAVPGWIRRQGMRVLWTRFTPQSLDTLLGFVDLAALNTLATLIPAPALEDTIGARNIWRVTAERMQATSVRWFPGVSLFALASTSDAKESADEVNRHGDLIPVACGLDSLFWRATLRPAFRRLTRLGGARPDVISGVTLDLDSAMMYYRGSGFCDADYRVGLAGLALDSADQSHLAALPPVVRHDTLLERGWLGRYFSALEAGVAERASALRVELRRLHPDLWFAFHASETPADWFSLGLLRGFSSRDAPALLWLRERRGGARELIRRYREREVYALPALRLEPDRTTFAPGEAARLRAAVFGENAGFWLDGTATDSLGRVIRRFVR